MPYEWTTGFEAPEESGALPFARTLVVRPHRSLGDRGFALFITATACLLALPILALLGTPALWVILVFVLAALAAIWLALRRNQRDLALTETLTLSRDEARLTRRAPDGSEQVWMANPHWVRVILYPTEGPVPDYLTLKGGDREVELGAFLTPEERRALAGELRTELARLR
jgi:uncharacterized membrane protein